MDKNAILQLIRERESQIESARNKRAIKTILAFAVVIFIFFYSTQKPIGIEILGYAAAAIFLAGVYFLINGIIFSQLFNASESERKMLDSLKKQLSEAENETH